MKQFPALTDGGRLIYISDSTGSLIHGVEYSSDWYQDNLKSQGGWSLEMIDTGFPFFDKGNWIASVSKTGGTPGSVNSVSNSNPDITFSGIENVFPDDSISIRLRFSEPVFSLQEMISSIKTGEKGIKSISPIDPLMREFSFVPEEPLQENRIYQLKVSEDIFDFAGNRMQKDDFEFGLTEPAIEGDVLFNELLFNPLPGDPDYLELFNCSEKIIDASRLQLVSVNDATGNKSAMVPVSDEGRCFLPGGYLAVTTDTKKILQRYFSADADHLFTAVTLPSMPDDKGHLILYNRELEPLDEFLYNDGMHYSLISDHEGVALEKINPRNKSGETTNWHSATGTSGWGTPGAPNWCS